MNHSLFYLKHMIWIGVQPLASKKTIESIQTRAIKQHNCRFVGWYLLSERLAERTRAYQQNNQIF
jgi:hypothetical protein